MYRAELRVYVFILVSYYVSCELLCIDGNEPQAAAYIIQAAFGRGLSAVLSYTEG